MHFSPAKIQDMKASFSLEMLLQAKQDPSLGNLQIAAVCKSEGVEIQKDVNLVLKDMQVLEVLVVAMLV